MITLEFSTFLGRFHPLFVHLPIGFLVLAIVFEWYENYRKTETHSRLIPIAWFLGGLSALAAAFSGWWLGETGLYEEDLLFSHRWLGVALVVVAFIGWWIKRKPGAHATLVHTGVNIILLVMLFVEGHKGGNLTHGETYLTEFAPRPVQKILGISSKIDSLPTFRTPDSVLVYRDLIHPIFEEKCVACHNDEVRRGGLNMSHGDSLQVGGDEGQAVVPGNLSESELFKRITLPQKNIKFMPPTKNVLTYDEIKTIEWWITQGASLEDQVSAMEVTENIKPVLLRRYGLDTDPKPWYEMVRLPAADSIQIATLTRAGFTVKSLGASNPLLDIKYTDNNLTLGKLRELEKVKEHITWLSLAQTNIEDDWLSIIGQFSNLTRLELEKTTVTDIGVTHLSRLEHLEALNLYGTDVTDASLSDIEKIGSLRRVYLWGTEVNPQTAKTIGEKNEELEIIIGER